MSTKLPVRKIGDSLVTAIGYGAMGIAASYGKVDSDEERLKFLDGLYERGCTNWDTADRYRDSEDLIGKWFKRSGKRSEIFLATKFGSSSDPARPFNGDPEFVKAAFERSLTRLGVDYVDLYYLHRADPLVPIEKTVGAMAELVKAGKVRYLGLSEVSPSTLRRAHAVHRISALQVEYSPFALDIEKLGLLAAARELGINIVAYSPLGRGLLSGTITSPDQFEPGDFRTQLPRFSKENFPKILKLVDGLKAIGDRHGATSGQVSLAWLLAQGEDIIPIPGTKKLKYLDENLGAAQLKLTEEEVREVRELAEKADVANGPRNPPHMDKYMLVDTPELVD